MTSIIMHTTKRHVCLLVLSFSALFSEAATGGLIRERYRTDRSCSLSSFSQADLQPYEACSVLPLNGENKFGRILIQFGETDCQFELQQCLPNVCYVLRDFSALLPKDLNLTSLQTPSNTPVNTGIFRNISVEGANFILSDEGIFLSPSSDNIIIRYSTKSCAEFYQHHGREWPQICSEPMGLLSNVYPLYQTLDSIGCKANL